MDLYNLVLSAKITKGEGGGGDEPTGTKEINITQNGVTTEDVKSYASAKITTSVPVGVFPSGTKQISSNGSYDVSNFASAAVNISPIIQSLSISENGTYSVPSGVDGYSPVTVSVPQSGITPIGTSMITSNGLYDITNYSQASVSVPIPSGYIQPTGTSSITANGIYDIKSFASVDVQVSGGGGGDHDVEDSFITRTISGTYENSRVTSIGSNAFYSCKSLATVSFPNVTSIWSSAFYGCTRLTTASFPNVTAICDQAFRTCNKLMSLYVLASSVVTLGVSAFVGTPMSNSTYTGSFGSIYVPASLINSYKTATNWSVYAARITSYVE